MKMRFGYTSDTTEIGTKIICRVTGGPYSHVFVDFLDNDGQEVYFESLWKKDPTTGKDGLRGPMPLSNVVDWQAEDVAHRRLEMQPADGWLPLSQTEAQAAYDTMLSMVGRIRYAPGQLVQNWFGRRTGLFVRFGGGSRNAWTCSETCIYCLPSRFWNCYEIPFFTADDQAPSGTGLPSIYEGTRKLIAIHGRRTDAKAWSQKREPGPAPNVA